MTDALADLLAAVDRTVAHATFAVTAAVAVRDDVDAPATSRGYCDLDVPLVASAWSTVGGPPHPGLLHGTSLHLAVPDWVTLDVHGVAASELLPLYWLRAATSAAALNDDVPGDRVPGDEVLAVEVDLAAAADANPPAVARSVRHDELGPLQAARGTARGTVRLSTAGLVDRIDLAVTGASACTVVLTLVPVTRRALDPADVVPGADLSAVVEALIDPVR
ncbi:hypothetical protein GTR02_08390 [Kineococcus sp. R8]|uniref:hypothetical protein n=1 Tax=Kineococcus siccus TaxID=2696567 RepID=UPI001412887B|nr:hypothetical protein [Kineococcus siccus]NAZ81837.1 hypothetical protein [Kineococcus siccus]